MQLTHAVTVAVSLNKSAIDSLPHPATRHTGEPIQSTFCRAFDYTVQIEIALTEDECSTLRIKT